MNRNLKFPYVFLLCFLSLNLSSPGQESTQFKVEVKNVHLPLLIFDRGQAIKLNKENFRISLVDCFSQTLKNSLKLLGIPVLEKM